jgi:hypothetical protein
MKTSVLAGLIIALAALLLPTSRGLAKAAYSLPDQMIADSEVIAVVDISRVEPTKAKGATWTYREVAHASVERVLKGELPKNIELHGNEEFICAQVRFKAGRHLVFLRRDQQYVVGSNWHLSVRPIKDDAIEWYASSKGIDLSWQPLAAVLRGVERAASNRH